MVPGVAAQGGAAAAYTQIQAERSRADSLLRAGDAAGLALLEGLLTRLERPELRDLANGNPYLGNRILNIHLDLVRATLARGDTVAARRWLRAAMSGDYGIFVSRAQFEGTAALSALLDDDVRAALAVRDAREARRTNAAFDTPASLTEDDRVAALSLLWAEVRWGFPNRERGAMPVWDSLYRATLPLVRRAEDPWEFWQLLRQLAARLGDGHTNVYAPPALSARFWLRPPVATERIEGHVVIRGASTAARALGIEPGAVIELIDGEPVDRYAERKIAPYQSASTRQDLEVRTYAYDLLRGPRDLPVRLTMRLADGGAREVSLPRDTPPDTGRSPLVRDSILPGGIGYLRVDDFSADTVPVLLRQALDRLAETRGLVVDIRWNGGGSTSYGFPILQAIATRRFALSSSWTLSVPSLFRARGFDAVPIYLPVDSIAPNPDRHYASPVVLLVGPRTFSAAEDFAVAWRGINRGPIIGSATGGSTGQPLFFPLPGGGRARVRTKHDVGPGGVEFDGVGVQPDIRLTPTLVGVRAGRDEVLEAAVRLLQGGG